MVKRTNKKSKKITDEEFNDYFNRGYIKKLEREINYVFSAIIGTSATVLTVISIILQYDSLNIEGTSKFFFIFKNPVIIAFIIMVEISILIGGILLTNKMLRKINLLEEEELKKQLFLNKHPKYDKLKQNM